jgi:hypothetical protein
MADRHGLCHIAAAVFGPGIAAALIVVHALIVAAVVILGLAVVGLVAFLSWRATRKPSPPCWRRGILIEDSRQQVSAPPQPRAAIEQPGGLHLHGVSAEDVAAIIERSRHE